LIPVLIVILLTLVLFVVALVEKGFSHDLPLEAGVFLVSVKLVSMSYKNGVTTLQLQKTIDEILEATHRRQQKEDT
jgi:hypothetical protein